MRKLTLTLLLVFLIGVSTFSQSSVRVLDLQQCVDIAIENNLTVRKSKLQQESANVTYTQSKAAMLPNLNLGGSYGSQWGRSIDPITNDYVTQQFSYTSFNGSSSVTLFNWFRILNTVKQSRYGLDAAGYDYEKSVNDLSLNIVTYYINVIFNRELLGNAEYQLQSSQEQLERTKKLVAGGALPRTNELELISQVATNEVSLVNAQNDLNLALLNLKQAMLIPVAEEIELVIPDLDDEQSDVIATADDVYLEALNVMPEIQSAQLQVDQAVMGVKIAQAGYAPSLSLNGSFSTNYSDAYTEFIYDQDNPYTIETDANGNYVTDTDPTFLITSDGTPVELLSYSVNGVSRTISFKDQLDQNLSRSLYLSLSIPVFNRLSARSSVQNAKISLQQAEIGVMEQKNQLRQTIEQAYNDAYAASKTYAASQKQVDALEETFRSINKQYNLGAANFTEYQVASNNLYQAKSDLVRAKFDFIFKTKVLDFYQGKNLTF